MTDKKQQPADDDENWPTESDFFNSKADRFADNDSADQAHPEDDHQDDLEDDLLIEDLLEAEVIADPPIADDNPLSTLNDTLILNSPSSAPPLGLQDDASDDADFQGIEIAEDDHLATADLDDEDIEYAEVADAGSDVAPEFADTWVPDGPSPGVANDVTSDDAPTAEIVSDEDDFDLDSEFEETWVNTPPADIPSATAESVEVANSAVDNEHEPDDHPEAEFRQTVSMHGPPQAPTPTGDVPQVPSAVTEDLPLFAEPISIFDVDENGNEDRDNEVDPNATVAGGPGAVDPKATIVSGPPAIDPNATFVGEPPANNPNATRVNAGTPVDPNATIVGATIPGDLDNAPKSTGRATVATSTISIDRATGAFEKDAARPRMDSTQNAGAHIPQNQGIQKSVESRLNVKHRPVSGSPFGADEYADYQVLSQVGAGAMGVVYSAKQTSINRELTFKTLKSWWETLTAPLKARLDEDQYFKICQQLRDNGSLSPKMTRELRTSIGEQEVERLSVQLRTMGNSMAGAAAQNEQWKRDLFLSEAIVTGNLVHPNIIPVHDMGVMEDGTLFYSMKWVHGTPWDKQLLSMSLRDNLKTLLSMCDAIAFAHHKGIINRDLKPENVMLGEFGEVLVLDWGLAIATSAFRKKDDITTQARPGSGTPVYMAPELLNGPMEEIGTWSDVYLLAAILFEIATGNPPHDFSQSANMTASQRRSQIFKIVGENQIRDPGVSGELIDIALKSLNTDPNLRHQSVNEFKQAILDYLTHAESLRLSQRADELVEVAADRVAEKGYDDYQTATALYEEALLEWPENEQAASGLDGTRIKYAQVAYKKGDYDLGLHVLSDQDDPESERQKSKLKRARRNRAGMKWTILGSLATILIGGSAAYWRISQDRAAKLQLIGDVQAAEQKVASADVTARAKISLAQTQADQSIAAATQKAAAKVSAAETEAKQKIRFANQMASSKVAEAEREYEQRINMANIQVAKANDKVTESEAKARKIQDSLVAAKQQVQTAEQQLKTVEKQKDAAEQQRQLAEFRGFKAQADGYIRAGQYSSAVPILRQLIESKTNEFAKRNRLSIQRTLDQVLQSSTSTSLPVETGAVSRDGKTLLMGQNDRVGRSAQILVRDVASVDQADGTNGDSTDSSTKPNQTTITLDTEVTGVVLSPDGRTVVAASGRSVLLWDLPDRQTKRVLKTFNSTVNAMAFNAQGRLLFVGAQDGTLQVVRVSDGRVIGGTRFGSAVRDLALFPDDSVILTAQGRGEQSICVANRVQTNGDSVSLTRMGQLGLPVDNRVPIASIAISPNADWLAVSNSRNGDVFVFPRRQNGRTNPNSKRGTGRINSTSRGANAFPFVGGSELKHEGWQLIGHTRKVNSLSFSANGKQLVTGSDDYTLGVWQLNDSPTDQFRFKRTHTLKGHGGAVETCAFLPQQRDRVVSMSRDQFVRVWNLQDYQQLRENILKDTDVVIEAKSAKLTPTKTFNRSPFNTTSVAFTSVRSRDAAPKTEPLGTEPQGTEPQVIESQIDTPAPNGISIRQSQPAVIQTISQTTSPTVQKKNVVRSEIVIDAHEAGVLSARFNSDGRRLLTASRDRTARVWDTTTATQISSSSAVEQEAAFQQEVFDEGHVYNVNALKFFPNGKRLLTSAYGSMSLWDVQPNVPGTGYEIARLGGIGVYGVADISRDGKQILTSARGNTARLWNTNDVVSADQPRPSHTLTGAHKFPVTAVAISPSGQRLVTGARRGKLVIWDAATAQPLSTKVGAHGGDQVSAVRFLSERRLLSAGFDGQITLWDVSSNGHIEVVHKFKQIGGFVTLLETSPDATQLVAAIRKRKGKTWTTIMRLWNVRQQQPIRTFDVQSIHGRVSRDDRDSSTAKQTAKETAKEIDVESVSWSADGSRLAVTTNNVLTIMNAESWDVVSRVTERTGRMASALVAFRPDADESGPNYLATSNGVATHLWDLTSGNHVVSFRAHAAVFSSAWSPDELFVVTASRSLRIFSAPGGKASGKSLFKIEKPHDGPVTHVEFSPNRNTRRFVSVGLDGSAHVWNWNPDTNRIRRLRTLKTTDNSPLHINYATWSPDGKTVLTASDDGQPRLWSIDKSTAPVVLPLKQLDDPWNCLCGGFSADGKWVAVGGLKTSSQESTGYVWSLTDANQPKQHCSIAGHGQGGISAMRFANDNSFLITGGSDGAVYQWDWLPDALSNDFAALNVFTFARKGKNEAHQGRITEIDTATDGRIVTASEDGTAVIWHQFQQSTIVPLSRLPVER